MTYNKYLDRFMSDPTYFGKAEMVSEWVHTPPDPMEYCLASLASLVPKPESQSQSRPLPRRLYEASTSIEEAVAKHQQRMKQAYTEYYTEYFTKHFIDTLVDHSNVLGYFCNVPTEYARDAYRTGVHLTTLSNEVKAKHQDREYREQAWKDGTEELQAIFELLPQYKEDRIYYAKITLMVLARATFFCHDEKYRLSRLNALFCNTKRKIALLYTVKMPGQ